MQHTSIILLSGGLDSATTLAIAQDQGGRCIALSFDYGQRHDAELNAARKIAEHYQVQHHVFKLDLSAFKGSALLNTALSVPAAEGANDGIPNTYVPARNTIFLSVALGLAETYGASKIGLGINAVDYSGYPDCRPEFIAAFDQLARLATQVGVKGGQAPQIDAPLVTMTKAQIIQTGIALGVDYGMTVSCYQADVEGRACGVCESCGYRREGFSAAGIKDPTRYR